MHYGKSGVTSNPSTNATWNSNYIGVWNLENNFDDATSNSNNGTNHGSASTTGKIGLCRDFDGNNDYIQGNTQLVNSYPFSVSAWVKAHNIGSSDWTVFNVSNNTSSSKYYGFFLGEDEDGKVVMRARNSSPKNINSQVKADDNVWHYVSCVYTSSNLRKVYVDGVLKGTNTSTSHYNTGVNVWGIGRWSDSTPKSYFKGSIDEVHFSNVSLSADWIKTAYYNQNSPSSFYTVSSS